MSEPALYQRLLVVRECKSDGDIQRDLHRTFPNHKLYRDRNGPGQQALYRVLRAYAVYDPDLGYCQGMGFIVAVLLMYMSEEESFWALCVLVRTKPYVLAGMYRPGLPLLKLCHYQLEQLIAHFLPRLSQHMDREGVSPALYAPEWFITIFSRSFPFPPVLRIWDSFFFEGIKVVFRVCLAILKLSQDDLLRLKFEGIMSYLREIPPKHLNPDLLMKTAFNIKLTRSRLARLEEQHSRQDQANVQMNSSHGAASLSVRSGVPGRVR